MAGFFRNYGWRAYALPLLTVLTALAFFWASQPSRLPDTETPGAGPQLPAGPSQTAGPSNSAPPTPLVPNPEAPKFDEAMASAELPDGGPFSKQGDGSWSMVPGTGEPAGAGQLVTYTVEIEDGVELPGGPEGFAQVVDSTLSNPKSWIGSDEYAFRRVESGTPNVRVSLASQETARSICGFSIQFDASCWGNGRAVLNAARWERGAVAFQGNVVAYQQYLVNHEVGHGLGFGHRPCGEDGGLAPVMMQQTWGVANDYLAALGTDNISADGKACQPNPWPYPTAGG